MIQWNSLHQSKHLVFATNCEATNLSSKKYKHLKYQIHHFQYSSHLYSSIVQRNVRPISRRRIRKNSIRWIRWIHTCNFQKVLPLKSKKFSEKRDLMEKLEGINISLRFWILFTHLYILLRLTLYLFQKDRSQKLLLNRLSITYGQVTNKSS